MALHPPERRAGTEFYGRSPEAGPRAMSASGALGLAKAE
jgi:hypothetical protein